MGLFERIIDWFNRLSDLHRNGGGYTIVMIAMAAILALVKETRRSASERKRTYLAASIAVVALLGGFVAAATLRANAVPSPQRRSDCKGIVALSTDPGFRRGQSCAGSTLNNTSFDLDDQDEWQRPDLPSDPRWRSAVDLVADDVSLKTANPTVRMVSSIASPLSFTECLDRDSEAPRTEFLLQDVRKMSGICIVTNDGRRALIKIDGGRHAVGAIQIHVVVWSRRS